MATTSLTIEVDADDARAFAQASPEAQKKMQLLLRLRLKDLLEPSEVPLLELMASIGREAEARGMTPEILQSILKER